MSEYKSVDIVVPNAGVNERGSFTSPKIVDGRPIKPSLMTLEINLIGVMYTAHLGLYYMKKNKIPGSLKSLVFIGSMGTCRRFVSRRFESESTFSILASD
jgi:short-subunit dehydrogenase